MHAIKDTPKLYKALFLAHKEKGYIYDFHLSGFDRLSITQLNEVGELLREEVFSTIEFQLALIKKLFYKVHFMTVHFLIPFPKNVQNFIGKTPSNMTQEEKKSKRDELSVILIWAKENLPVRHSVLLRLLAQEIMLLNE